jgi:hypothetical protein
MAEFNRATEAHSGTGGTEKERSEPLTNHCNSTSLASIALPVHFSSHAKNLMNLIYNDGSAQVHKRKGKKTHGTDEFVQYAHPLIPSSQQTLLNPNGPFRNETVQRPSEQQYDKPSERRPP